MRDETHEVGFEPKDVELRGVMPLLNTFCRSEYECAAACLIAACQRAGSWKAVSLEEAAQALEARPELRWRQNWAFRPDFSGLLERGWAALEPVRWGWKDWLPDAPREFALELTWAGLERLRYSPWVALSYDRRRPAHAAEDAA